MLIETDVLLALASREDKHHREVVDFIKRSKALSLSPYSLLETDLLIKSGSIEVDVRAFYESLTDLLEYYEIRVVEPHPSHFARAWILRREYGMTYFDSLHASVALLEGIPIVSYDEVYSDIKGLKRMRPKEVP